MFDDLYIKWAEGRLSEQEFLAIGLQVQNLIEMKLIAFNPDLIFRLDGEKKQIISIEFALNLLSKMKGSYAR